MKKNFNTLLIIFFSIFFTLIVGHSRTTKAYTFDKGATLGSSVLAPSYQLYIDGNTITNSKEVITVGSDKPSFFGYTVKKITVNLTIVGTTAKRITTSDKNGYWIYNLPEALPVGTHYLYMSINDTTKASSSAVHVATFRIPTTLESNIRKVVVPAPSLKTLDYLTVSLIVGSSVFVLIFLYLLAKRYAYPHE